MVKMIVRQKSTKHWKQDDAEEEVEDGIYPDNDDQQPQRPQRSARLDYAAMSRGLGRY